MKQQADVERGPLETIEELRTVSRMKDVCGLELESQACFDEQVHTIEPDFDVAVVDTDRIFLLDSQAPEAQLDGQCPAIHGNRKRIVVR